MDEFAIKVDELGKRYRIGHLESYRTLRDTLATSARAPLRGLRRSGAASVETRSRRDWIWALQDVSLQIAPGEIVGLVGANGAGKTTLLKILSKITSPSAGRGLVSGRVGSLLEVGTGFHPELTGRDNVYLNGIILGMRRREVAEKFDEIVEFAGVERFIDTPVKRYSSGMQVRLAFSVAAHLQPEVLLVDEVLAVGDAEFQRKSLGRMENVTREGRTVVFVSHNLTAIRKLCSRTILLSGGRVAMDGATDSVLDHYLRSVGADGSDSVVRADELERIERLVSFQDQLFFRCREVALKDAGGTARSSFKSDEEIVVSIDYDVFETVTNLQVIVQLHTEEGETILRTELHDDPDAGGLYVSKPGAYAVQCHLQPNLFGERRFYVTVHMICQDVQHTSYERVLQFDVAFMGYNGDLSVHSGAGYLRPQLSWDVLQAPGERLGPSRRQPAPRP
jgi:homopolymeric O-antigen transport system ATP-binding protein